MHWFIWILVLFALGLWSLLAWGTHAVLGIDPGWVGDLEPLLANVPYGALIDAWLPGWQVMLGQAIDFTQWLLGVVGRAAGPVVWIVWSGGALLLLAVGALASVAVALLRRATAGARPVAA